METVMFVLWVATALCAVIALLVSVATYRAQQQMFQYLMQVEAEGRPAFCAWCGAPAVAIGEQCEWVCASHAPRCSCGEVAVGKGYTGCVCAEHWPTANHLPTA